ncbi:hypothetical protein SAMN05444365_109109 [Micromonospora pattaloongensis]|uniref:Uncharacterized protein n=1 Tax=Micromonospora pattaloongensis TaxID=405436 RepID=A0A1H3RV44_9ACTN|nr:hypothetical protein [Micromonospora pattaloongensis]SDZ29547.1 hypothetical protein SAMN05444365_109109 [Micromonospora pattaloongensis]
MTNDADAILVGGPRDQDSVSAGGTALLELKIDGMIHRYIRTTQQRDQRTVYNYDGMVAPGGGEPGVEDPAARVASPLEEAER